MRLLIFAALLVWNANLARAATPDARTAVDRAFSRLYNFDFAGARGILDEQISLDPTAPLPHAVKAAAYLFSELDRLHILELDFFMDDEKMIDRRKLVPDPKVRQAFVESLGTAQRLAQERLAAKPDDPEMLFAMVMTTGLAMDYGAFIERRRLGSYSLAKSTHFYARKLLALNPPVYDAYMTSGTIEYVLGSMPFFIRWFLPFDQIKGSKQRGLEQLELVSQRGRYYGPLARVMLAVIHIREKRPAQAEPLIQGLVADFPENPLFRKELERVRRMPRRAKR